MPKGIPEGKISPGIPVRPVGLGKSWGLDGGRQRSQERQGVCFNGLGQERSVWAEWERASGVQEARSVLDVDGSSKGVRRGLCRGRPEKARKGKKGPATFLSSSAGPPGCGLPGIYPPRSGAAIFSLPGPRFFAVFSRFPEASQGRIRN